MLNVRQVRDQICTTALTESCDLGLAAGSACEGSLEREMDRAVIEMQSKWIFSDSEIKLRSENAFAPQ